MNDLLVWVQDVLAAEHFVCKCTDEILGNPSLTNDIEASQLVRLVNQRARMHVNDIEALLAQLDEEPSTVRQALGAGLGTTLGWMERLANRSPIQVVRDIYVALNHTAAGYHVLYTRAILLERPAAAGLALRHLRDYTPAIRELSQLLAWAASLGLPIPRGQEGAMKQIVTTLFECWSSDVPLDS